MRRRDFIALGSAAATASIVWPPAARAQRPVRRIGYLSISSAPSPFIASFRTGMREQGHSEGRDYVIEVRYAGWNYDRLPALADELVRAGIAVMVTEGPATKVAALAGQSVPVVFAFSGDPVDAGLVTSLARPGGNVTGISFLSLDLSIKRVDLLKEAVPTITRLAVLANPEHAGEQSELRVTRKTAADLGLTVEYYQVRATADFDRVFATVARDRCDALLAFPDALTSLNREPLAAFALQHRLPTIFGWKLFADAGGLMSYGPNLSHAYVRVAALVDKILKGAKPVDTPVEQSARLELIINLKTARTLGLTVPRALLYRADEVIE